MSRIRSTGVRKFNCENSRHLIQSFDFRKQPLNHSSSNFCRFCTQNRDHIPTQHFAIKEPKSISEKNIWEKRKKWVFFTLPNRGNLASVSRLKCGSISNDWDLSLPFINPRDIVEVIIFWFLVSDIEAGIKFPRHTSRVSIPNLYLLVIHTDVLQRSVLKFYKNKSAQLVANNTAVFIINPTVHFTTLEP